MIIDNKTGKYFPKAFVYIGYALIVIGVLLVVEKGYTGIGLIIIGIYLGLSYIGIQIDPDKKKFKKYSCFFGLKKGTWESYNDYPYLSILDIREKHTSYSRGGVEYISKEKVYRVCLLNKTHRKKIIVKNFKSKEKASFSASKIAKQLEVQQTTYSPKASEKTRLRRKRK